MKTLSITMIGVTLLSGCAHSRPPGDKNSAPFSPKTPSSNSAQPAGIRVSLPYVFSRGGVEIRVYSVEFSGDQLIVTTSMLETRGTVVDLDASKLLKAQTARGEEFPFTTVNKGGQTLPSPVIRFASKEKSSVTFTFALGSNPDKQVQLLFPTGKWWSSGRDGAEGR